MNDANSDAAKAYTIGSIRRGLDRNPRGRYFEPAPGRNRLAGVEASYTF